MDFIEMWYGEVIICRRCQVWYLVRKTEWNFVGFFLECRWISGMNYWYVQVT